MKPLDSHRVYMSWDRPPQPGGHILSYLISWRLNNKRQSMITVSSRENYTFEGLSPGQTVRARVSSHIELEDDEESVITSTPSREVRATTLSSDEGESFLLVLLIAQTSFKANSI